VRFGTECPEGFLPVYSVGSEDEAKLLLTMACQTDRTSGEWVAKELMHEQNLDNLDAFGDRLSELHDKHMLGTERCDCKGLKKKSKKKSKRKVKRR